MIHLLGMIALYAAGLWMLGLVLGGMLHGLAVMLYGVLVFPVRYVIRRARR